MRETRHIMKEKEQKKTGCEKKGKTSSERGRTERDNSKSHAKKSEEKVYLALKHYLSF